MFGLAYIGDKLCRNAAPARRGAAEARAIACTLTVRAGVAEGPSVASLEALRARAAITDARGNRVEFA